MMMDLSDQHVKHLQLILSMLISMDAGLVGSTSNQIYKLAEKLLSGIGSIQHGTVG